MTCEEVRQSMTKHGGPFSATRGERGAVFDHLSGCPDCELWMTAKTGIPANAEGEDADRIIERLIAAGRVTREQVEDILAMIAGDAADPEFRS